MCGSFPICLCPTFLLCRIDTIIRSRALSSFVEQKGSLSYTCSGENRPELGSSISIQSKIARGKHNLTVHLGSHISLWCPHGLYPLLLFAHLILDWLISEPEQQSLINSYAPWLPHFWFDPYAQSPALQPLWASLDEFWQAYGVLYNRVGRHEAW